MKKVIVSIAFLIFFISCKQEKKETTETVVEEMEMPESEWEILFDGTSLDKWKEFQNDTVGDVWKIDGDALIYTPPSEGEDNKNHDLVTRDEYTDFVLSLEWKISEAGNSGVFWGVNEDAKYSTGYQTGPEVQILDNDKQIGEWNTMVITVNHKDNMGNVILNGTEMVTFPVQGEEWDAMVADSKFAGWEGFGKFTTGKIGLQDHGNVVAFRNIKIKQL